MFDALTVESDSDGSDNQLNTDIAPEASTLSYILDLPLDLLDCPDFKPRGLLNQRNNCFSNSVLQSLFAFSAFRSFLCRLAVVAEHLDNFSTPVCFACHFLFQQWIAEQDLIEWKAPAIYPFSLDFVINRFSDNYLGRHEDVHDFFHYLIEAIHDELVRLKTGLSPEQLTESLNYGFTPVRSRNNRKPVVHVLQDSLISRIFGGRVRTCLTKANGKNTSEVAPFFSLPLSINSNDITSVKDALLAFAEKTQIRGLKVADSEIKAYQASFILDLPKVLCLQLKRFAMLDSQIIKISRHIRFEERFQFPNSVLVSPSSEVNCRLQAVVCHIGDDATHGHYVTCFRHKNLGWLLANDATITRIKWKDVQMQQAYMLFYEVQK